FVDITERKRAIEALDESRESMRLMFEAAKDYAIFTTDGERKISGWNAGAESMFGYTEPEILGQSADILFAAEDRAKGDPGREAQRGGDEGRVATERWHARKDGSKFYGSGAVMPLRDKSGSVRGFAKIIRDLTEKKRTEEAMHEQMDELGRFNALVVGR